MTTKVLILGASGMLGNMVFRAFRARDSFEVVGTVRSNSILQYFDVEDRAYVLTNVDVLDADALVTLMERVRPGLVINCIGLVKQLSSVKDPLVALPINALFPHRLARLCALAGARLIHISTDCVFSGRVGAYVESDIPDADDLYGRSKLLGELIDYPHAVTLRTSIIGRELATSHSLIDWFLSQSGSIKGFRRAIFSGLPTCELAGLMRDVVAPKAELSGLYHVSSEPISKFDLLELVADRYGKSIEIVADDGLVIDRSLDSKQFSAASGYTAPDWPELIRRMHNSDQRWKTEHVRQ
jgi:dTDP-4-dehydrorhamnose reductase